MRLVKHRVAAVYQCERCGEPFHPCSNSAKRFCSPECTVAEQREVSARMRAEAVARAYTPLTPDEHAIALEVRDEMVAALAEREAWLRARDKEVSR